MLLALAARELSVPYVVSGGCADGKQLAAALALGAEGMNMGTRFMATQEAPIHPNVKKALLDGDEMSTTLVMRSVKNTERVYKNQTAMEVGARNHSILNAGFTFVATPHHTRSTHSFVRIVGEMGGLD